MYLPVESSVDQILSQLTSANSPNLPRKVLFWEEGGGDVSSYIAGWMAGHGMDIIVLDGANRFDPYTVSSYAKKALIPPERLLKRIRIARAFTCYQMATLVEEKLIALIRQEEAISQTHKPRVILLGPMTTFLDGDVPERESRFLFERMLRKVGEAAMEGVSFYLFQPNPGFPLFANTNKINSFAKNCRVRSPNAPFRGVIGDHALQSRKDKKCVCIKKGSGGFVDSRRAFLARRLFQISTLVWRIHWDDEGPKMILEKSLTENHETKDLRLRLGGQFRLE
ncbi:MAG: hypothetical protein ACUVWO_10930 [Thermodesulfobacteriota bacterium]